MAVTIYDLIQDENEDFRYGFNKATKEEIIQIVAESLINCKFYHTKINRKIDPSSFTPIKELQLTWEIDLDFFETQLKLLKAKKRFRQSVKNMK